MAAQSAQPRIPQPKTAYYPFKGGLDLVSPAITANPGSCFSAQNYEPSPNANGGYRRINGRERSDGRPSPTAASYWLLSITLSGTIAVGATVTGVTSAATGKVLSTSSTLLVLGRVTGTFVSGEVLNVAATPQATTTSAALLNGATSAADHATDRLLAANDRRADILIVPGSGAIRGIFVLADVVYAFRDNLGGTAGDLYKQTAGGWAQVTFGRELQFTTATAEISAGQTVTGATSGATAVVVRALLRTGTWAAAGAGTLVFASVTGVFVSGENIQVAAVTKVVSSSVDTAIVRLPAGRVETVRANFSGSTVSKRTYGADGVNLAFEFDGTTYVPIRTGMTTDTPVHIEQHKNRLFLTFASSLQFSGINAPYSWTALTGAAEIAMGSDITGIQSVKGNAASASLLVSVTDSYSILYGSTSTDFTLVPSGSDIGFAAYTLQSVGNDIFGLTSRGIQSLVTTLNYGSFDYAAISTLVRPLLAAKAGLQTASVSLKTKDQYRLFFSDNTGVVVGLTGGKISGILSLNYGLVVRCVCNATLTTGVEVTYIGSDDGYVYLDNIGTSFDGSVIEAWIRPQFNNLQSPMLRKTYLRAFFEVSCEGYAVVNATYDLGYGSPAVASAAAQDDQTIVGPGGFWDEVTWDEFTWDAPLVTSAYLSIDGTENNISFLFHSSRAQDDSHTFQGVNLQFVPRRLTRGGS